MNVTDFAFCAAASYGPLRRGRRFGREDQGVRVGVIFPQTEIGTDPVVIRDFAQTAEALGYHHVLAYDHVLGATVAVRRPRLGPYTIEHMFHEPFVLFGYVAAYTRRIELVTGILILPQRQTALVAKQAAEVDVLSGGRLRFGVGVGWNDVEYEALEANFRTRGARMEEQIEVLRALWTQPSVTFHGRWHHISDAGINPLPLKRPIPLWMGGEADVVLHRAARLADGWMSSRGTQAPVDRPAGPSRDHQVGRLRHYLAQADRDAATFGIEGRVAFRQGGPVEWRHQVEAWRRLGATHVSVDTMRAGLSGPQAHIDAIRRFHEAMTE